MATCPHGVPSSSRIRCEVCALMQGSGGACPHGLPRRSRCHYCDAERMKKRLNQRASAENLGELRRRRVAENYLRRFREPRGGAMPLFATRTGDITLPNPVRYDTMGYAWGLGVEDETPAIQPLPWDLEKPEDPITAAAEARWSKIEKAGTVIGVLGGAIGLYFSVKALMSSKSEE